MAHKRPGTSEESHIDIVPIGEVDALAVSVVAANLQTLMGLNADTLPSHPEPEYAYLPLRSQYAAGKSSKNSNQSMRVHDSSWGSFSATSVHRFLNSCSANPSLAARPP